MAKEFGTSDDPDINQGDDDDKDKNDEVDKEEEVHKVRCRGAPLSPAPLIYGGF